jgi:REase_DpnII-MboI
LAAKAIRDAMDKSLASANPANVWRFMGFKVYMAKYNEVVLAVSKLVKITVPIGTWKLDKVGSQMDTNAFTQQGYFESVYTSLNLLVSFIEHTIGLKNDEIHSLRDFFQANLRRAVFKTPKDEGDIQDVIEQLLVGRGMTRGVDYDREVGRVRVSIKEVVPDFILPRLSLAIEAKLSKDKAKSKKIVDEINADIQAYGKKYSAIIFIVYDLGSIQDEAAFKLGLEKTENYIHILVVKH